MCVCIYNPYISHITGDISYVTSIFMHMSYGFIWVLAIHDVWEAAFLVGTHSRKNAAPLNPC